MYTLGPFSLSNPVTVDPKASNLFNNQPIVAILIQNNSGSYVVFEYGAGTADYVPPFGPYLLNLPVPTTQPKTITYSSLNPNPLPTDNILVTVYQNGDTVPNVQNVPSPTAVSLQNFEIATLNIPAGNSSFTVPIPGNVHSVKFFYKFATILDSVVYQIIGVQTGYNYTANFATGATTSQAADGIVVTSISPVDTQITITYTGATSAATVFIEGSSDPTNINVNVLGISSFAEVPEMNQSAYVQTSTSGNLVTIPGGSTYRLWTATITAFRGTSAGQATLGLSTGVTLATVFVDASNTTVFTVVVRWQGGLPIAGGKSVQASISQPTGQTAITLQYSLS